MVSSNLRLGFLASHNGSNVQNIVDACKRDEIRAVPKIVISNNSDSEVLKRAARAGIPSCHLSTKTCPEPDELDMSILTALQDHDVNLVLLAGYMRPLGKKTICHYRGRILNIHPSLLPAYGGKGMYGDRVHAAVLESGDKVTGVTVHLVDEEYDQGIVITQSTVPVLYGDTVDILKGRVLRSEHDLYVRTLQRISIGEIRLPTSL